jgi:DNA polymerase-3 subunit delta
MSQPDVKPVYVLHGSDGFLLDAHRRELVALIIGDADPQVAVSSFDADASVADVLDELRTAPFLAPRRAVIVREAHTFLTQNRKPLEEFFAKPPPSTASLILMLRVWKGNGKLEKRLLQIGEKIECSVPEKGSLRGWLQKAAGKRGKKLAADAPELLEQWVGRAYGTLDAEIEKLSLYVGERDTITLADVSAVVVASAGPQAFALTNAITEGDVPAALDALGGMLNVRGEEFRTLGMLAWHLRRALKAKRELDAAGRFSIALPYDRRGPFSGYLRRRPLERFHQDFRRLLRADLGMKTGAAPRATLQELVLALCS